MSTNIVVLVQRNGIPIIKMIRSKQPSRMLLVFGNTQMGKSSFINTRVGYNMAQAGDGGGESTTAVIRIYDVGYSRVFFPEDEGHTKLSIVDIPGLRDSKLTFTTEEILDKIKFKLFEEKCIQLDGVLIFDSFQSSMITLRSSLDSAKGLFGPKVESSAIGILTKWDDTDEGQREKKAKGFAAITNIPTVRWQNETEDSNPTEEVKVEQIANLQRALKRIEPYYVDEINKLEEECKERALALRENNPDRYNTVPQEYTEQKVEIYSEDEEYLECEPVYTTEEAIEQRALELRERAGTHPVQITKVVTEDRKEYYQEVETKEISHTVEGSRKYIIAGPREKTTYTTTYQTPVQRERIVKAEKCQNEVVQEYYPIENYRQLAINEKKEVKKTRRVSRQKLTPVTKIRDNKVEKYDFSHYIQEARKIMIEEYRKKSALDN